MGSGAGTVRGGDDPEGARAPAVPAGFSGEDAAGFLDMVLGNMRGMAYRCYNDAEWTMAFVSEGCRELTGYDPADLVGNRRVSFNSLIVEADRGRVWAEVQQALSAGRSFDLAYRIRTATGEERWLSERGRGRRGADGRWVVEGVVADITALKRAEVAIGEREDCFSLAFNCARDMMVLARVEAGGEFRIVAVNRSYEEAMNAAGFPVSNEAMAGRTFDEVRSFFGFDDDQWARLKARYREAVATGRILRFEETTVTPNGRFLGDSMIAPVADPSGECRFVLYASADVSARRRVERELRETAEKFAKAFNASPGAMSISEPGGRGFIAVNDNYVRMFGYAREELLGRSLSDLGLWSSDDQKDLFMQAYAATGSVRDLEVVRRRRDGTLITCLLSAESIELDGRSCVIAALYDITGRKEAEAARAALQEQLRQTQKLEALGQLAGGVAHDFNNILTGIVAYTELAQMDAGSPDEVRRHLAAVRKASDRATDLVRQILTFSRKQPPERLPVRISGVVVEALRLLRSSIPATIAIEERIDPAGPIVLADKSQIHQVIMNLGTNAAHAMKGGPGRLSVRLVRSAVGPDGVPGARDLPPGAYARIEVEDTGHGISGAVLARIFEPFFTTKATGEGTGLGLAVVHGIVRDHQGAIVVRSRPGEGTCFEIYLPEHEDPPADEPSGARVLPPGRGERVLLVDDEAPIVFATSILLRRLGYAVAAHGDPREAWDAFAADPSAFDVVISDMTMPHLTGVELAGRINERRPDLPILLTSGFSGGWTPDALQAIGVRRLLAKPIPAETLALALREVFATPVAKLR